MEKDDEVSGSGNSYTAMFWHYDSRLVRRWNQDPVVKYHKSPYATFSNNPIRNIDPKGDNADWYQGEEGLVWSSESEDAIDFNGSSYKNVNKGSDDLPVMMQGTGGTNLSIVGRENDFDGDNYNKEFDEQTTNAANGTGGTDRNVFALIDNKDDFLKALEVTSSNFGQINNAMIRSHGQPDGLIIGNWNSDNFRITEVPKLTKKIADGVIKMNKNSTFYFMGCNMHDLAKSYNAGTGLSAVGAIGSTGQKDGIGNFRVDPVDFQTGHGWYRYENNVI